MPWLQSPEGEDQKLWEKGGDSEVENWRSSMMRGKIWNRKEERNG
jgi:hypothetical protein